MNAFRDVNYHFWAVVLICFSLFFHITAPATATVMLNNGGLNNINAASDDLEVSDGPGATSTVVNVMTGADIGTNGDGRSIGLTQQSVLLFSGGSAQGNITMGDNSVAFLNGSANVAGDISADGDTELQINNSATVGGEVFAEGNATVSFLGGEVDTFGIGGNATATINGGSIDDDLDTEGDAVLTVIDVFVNDDVDAADNGVMNLMGGIYDEDVEATDSSTINISGGEFVRIASRGANLVASGGVINVSAGTFGTAGENDGGFIVAASGGVINMSGATIAGADTGAAAPVPIQSSLNGVVNIAGMEFNDLEVAALTGGRVDLTNVVADNLSLEFAAGLSTLDNVTADGFSLAANLGSIIWILDGDLGDGSITAFGGSKVTIFGSGFMVNGVPFAGGEIPFISGDISLTLPSGAQLNATFQRQPGPGNQAAIIELVPEPGSLTMIGVLAASIACLRRRTI